MGRQRNILKKLAETFYIRHMFLRQALAECLGTLILVESGVWSNLQLSSSFIQMFGCGSVAQLVLSRGSHGTFLSVNLAFGSAVTLGIILSGRISGGHLNPAVTFALCLLKREEWRNFPLFFFSQTLGAFLGATIIFGMYFDALWDFSHGELIVVGENATAGIFATYPSEHLSLVNGFFDQLIGTASLIVCILAIVDPYNSPVPRGLEPFTVGLVVSVIGLSMGFNCGYAVNPARDLGPRIFTAVAGWGAEVFFACSYWFLVPTCAPFLGAAVGVFLYQAMIGNHWNSEMHGNKKDEAREEGRLTRSTLRTNEEE